MKTNLPSLSLLIGGFFGVARGFGPSTSPSLLRTPAGTSSFTFSSRYYGQRSRYPDVRYATIPRVDEEAAVEEKKSDEIPSASSSSLLGRAVPYSELTIGVLKETYPGENRVSQTPDSVKGLVDAGFNVVVQSGGTFAGNLFQRILDGNDASSTPFYHQF